MQMAGISDEVYIQVVWLAMDIQARSFNEYCALLLPANSLDVMIQGPG